MISLRTEEMRAAYKKYVTDNPQGTTCPLCDKKPLRIFTHWKITVNDFPYDTIASTHHMIMPLRHVTEGELNEEERAEMIDIKNQFINPHYDNIIESTPQNKSVPAHFHLHLIVGKTKSR